MRQEPQNHSGFPNISLPNHQKKLQYRNGGLYCQEPIVCGELILSIPSSDIISTRNGLRNGQLSPIFCEGEQIMVIWLISLKCHHLCSPLPTPIRQWLSSDTSGFLGFPESLIRQTQHEQLIIEYSAYWDTLKRNSKSLYTLMHHNNCLQSILGVTNLSEQQFTDLYVWSIEFMSTRAFGYTTDTLLIPQMDYINYDPTKDCHKIEFVTWDTEDELEIIKERVMTAQNLQQEHNDYDSQYTQSSDEQCKVHNTLTKKYIGFICCKNLEKDQQMYLHYGNWNNTYLLKWYGFAIENNPYDSLTVYISKFWQPIMIHFSAVERTTFRVKIRGYYLCRQLINHWKQVYRNHHGPQQSNQQIEIIRLLLKQMIDHKPDFHRKFTTNYSEFKRIDKFANKYILKSQQQSFKWISLYLSEMDRLYSLQLIYIQQYIINFQANSQHF